LQQQITLEGAWNECQIYNARLVSFEEEGEYLEILKAIRNIGIAYNLAFLHLAIWYTKNNPHQDTLISGFGLQDRGTRTLISGTGPRLANKLKSSFGSLDTRESQIMFPAV
jgi:hypothetical protein